MRHYNIVLAVMRQGNNYLMQRRAKHPKVGAGGLIGFFGGKIEENEDPEKALYREIAEETTFEPSKNLKSIGKIQIEMAHTEGRARVTAEAFSIRVPNSTEVKAREWELVEMPVNDVKKHIDELTPATRAVFEEILWA
jgi:8-oxo-dGTP pyrophosphatase MutT (NUDIX family)